MTDTISYQYAAPSALQRSADQDELFLAKYSEIEKKETPCFFWGKLTQPYMTARCLIALSNVVQSSFNLTPSQLSMLKDPIVTAGNDRLRFEGFSNCAGVYARVDVLPDGHDGEFLENGTTNVDFNAGMISALGSISKQEKVVMSVGPKEVGLYNKGEKVIERKVPLPVKWIKGLTTVQIYQSVAERMYSFNRIQTLQLFQTLPKGTVKCDYYLVMRGQKPAFSPVKSLNAVCVGGVHRLRLLEPLLPLNQVQVQRSFSPSLSRITVCLTPPLPATRASIRFPSFDIISTFSSSNSFSAAIIRGLRLRIRSVLKGRRR